MSFYLYLRYKFRYRTLTNKQSVSFHNVCTSLCLCRFCKLDIGQNNGFFFYKEIIIAKWKSQYISLIFAQNMCSLYFLNSIHVSFYAAVWSVWLILHRSYLSLHVTQFLPVCSLISAGELFPRFLFSFNTFPDSTIKYQEKVGNIS